MPWVLGGSFQPAGGIQGMTERPVILVVEDDPVLAEMLVDHLRLSIDARVIHATGAADALRQVHRRRPDLAIVDIGLPDGDGLELIRLIRESCDCPALVITGCPTLQRSVEALRLGADDLLTKPFDLHELSIAVLQAVDRHRASHRERQRTRRLEGLVRRVLQDRRLLQQRVDLVCRDLVGAYRELAERFADGGRGGD